MHIGVRSKTQIIKKQCALSLELAVLHPAKPIPKFLLRPCAWVSLLLGRDSYNFTPSPCHCFRARFEFEMLMQYVLALHALYSGIMLREHCLHTESVCTFQCSAHGHNPFNCERTTKVGYETNGFIMD